MLRFRIMIFCNCVYGACVEMGISSLGIDFNAAYIHGKVFIKDNYFNS